MTRPGLLQDADLGVAAEQDPDADGRGYLQTCPKPTQGRGYRVTFPRKGVTDVLGKGLSRVKVQVGAVSLWSGCGQGVAGDGVVREVARMCVRGVVRGVVTMELWGLRRTAMSSAHLAHLSQVGVCLPMKGEVARS